MNDVQEINVDELMAQIRENLPNQQHAHVVGVIPPSSNGLAATELSTLQNNREIRYFRLTSHRKFLGSFVLLAKKLARKLLTPSLERQTGYNTANTRLVQHLWELTTDLQRVNQELVEQINGLRQGQTARVQELRHELIAQVQELRHELIAQVQELRHELIAQVREVRHELTEQHERYEELAEQIGGVHQEQEAAFHAIHGELAEHISAVHREQEAAFHAIHGELAEHISAVHGEQAVDLQELQARLVSEMARIRQEHGVAFQEMRERSSRAERRLRRFVASFHDGSNADISETLKSLHHPKLILESSPGPSFDYFGFEERFRGSEEDIKERQRVYVEFFKDVEPVLDIGCGRGEFLELAREAGIKANGVDVDLDMVLYCQEKELDVVREDAFAYLGSIPDASLGGIFAAQVVEHLEPTRIIELVDLCHRKLQMDGVLIFETPNPVCLSVFARSFYMDLSHNRPIHPEAMKFLLESAGFKDLQVRFSSPVEPSMHIPPISGTATSAQGIEEFNQGVERLNELLYGFQDFAVIGKKSSRL